MKSTTSANRIEAELKWSAIVRVSTLSRSAIDCGRTLSSRFSAFSCSTRSAASASRRWRANIASSVKKIAPPTAVMTVTGHGVPAVRHLAPHRIGDEFVLRLAGPFDVAIGVSLVRAEHFLKKEDVGR